MNSRNWPQDYPSYYQDCYWKIEVGKDQRIKIAFMDFDLDNDFGCYDDKVKVKGEKIKGQLCQLSVPARNFCLRAKVAPKTHFWGPDISRKGQRTSILFLIMQKRRNCWKVKEMKMAVYLKLT